MPCFLKLFLLCIVFNTGCLRLDIMAQHEGATNQSFLEKSIVESAAAFLDTLEVHGGGEIWLTITANIGREQATHFIEDVLLEQLLQAGYEVFLNRNRNLVSSDTLMPVRAALHIEAVLDNWVFFAQRSKDKNNAGAIEQIFRFQLRYRLLDAQSKALSAGKIDGQSSRDFYDLESYRAAQTGQPAFAQPESRFTMEKNNLINTIIISGITGLTVFLIYFLRSQ